MALDDREYSLARTGWNQHTLTGFRRSVDQETQDEYETYRQQSREYLAKLWIIGITTTTAAGFFAWHFFT